MASDRSKTGIFFFAGPTTARLIGSSTAGILELLIFHPVDTIAKRLMTNKQKVNTYIVHKYA